MMQRSLMRCCLLALLVLPVFARAQTPAPPPAPLPATVAPADEAMACRHADPGSSRPRIGLALGGGGARGIAHVAVIKELERLGVPIDCIAGTSFGALIGGLYASGMPIGEIETLVTTLDWQATFNDSLTRPERSFRRKRDDDLSLLSAKPGIGKGGIKLASGVLSGQSIILLLQRLTGPVARVSDFNKLPVPFRAVATDINTGKAVVLGDGNLAESMRASMSIPGVFRPVRIGEQILVDGGIADQVPADVVRAMGADIVIAVDVGTPLLVVDDSASVLTYADQLSGFMTVSNTNATIAALGPRDILVQPQMGEAVRTGDFDKAADALRIGEEAMLPLQPKFQALARPTVAKDSEELATAPVRVRDLPRIDFVRLDNHTIYKDRLLLNKLAIPVGQTLDIDRVEAGVESVYGLNTIDIVTYDVVDEDGKTGIIVHVRPNTYGPNYLETGLNLYSDFRGDFDFNLRVGLLRTPINPAGGEVRVLAQIGSEPGLLGEIYQPLGLSSRYFIGGRFSYETPHISVFAANGEREAEYELPSAGISGVFGREFGNFGAITVGLSRRSGSANRLVGAEEFPEIDFEVGQATWAATYDRLDSFQLPRDGLYFTVGQTVSRQDLGADTNFMQGDFDLIGAHVIGAHSAFYGLRYHETISGQANLPAFYRLGGVTRMAGYRPGELLASNYALGFVGYTYELGRVLNRPSILGGTIEYGRVWGDEALSGPDNSQVNASVYYGFDSWLGRFLFGYGARPGGEGSLFLELGRTY